jgi:hypothetical protein
MEEVSPKATSVNIRSGAHLSTVNPPPPEKRNQISANTALTFESPAWLAIASGCDSHRQVQSPVVDLTRIVNEDGNRGALQDVLAAVDPKTETLHITGAVPNNDQWEALGRHFTNVRFLKVGAGWDEDWIDDKFPLNWPLELLLVSDAGGERVTTPAIMEGRIKNLVLFYACELRFEGPVTEELMKGAEQLHFIPHKKATPDAQFEQQGATTQESSGTEPAGAKVFSDPHEVNKWVYNKYAGRSIVLDPHRKVGPPSAMTSLQILGNDAFQMLTFMAVAKFHLIASIKQLALDSRGGEDLVHFPPGLFLAVLPGLAELEHLKITFGSAAYATLLEGAEGQPFLHAALPANIETLHFRGPVSMVPHLDAFAAAFASNDFLPNLRRISFVLDQPDKSSDSPDEPSLDQLREAHARCREVLDAAAARGVLVDEFREPWVEEHSGLFKLVDNRWAVLDSIASS